MGRDLGSLRREAILKYRLFLFLQAAGVVTGCVAAQLDYAFLHPLLLGSGQWDISTLESPLNECLGRCMHMHITED